MLKTIVVVLLISVIFLFIECIYLRARRDGRQPAKFLWLRLNEAGMDRLIRCLSAGACCLVVCVAVIDIAASRWLESVLIMIAAYQLNAANWRRKAPDTAGDTAPITRDRSGDGKDGRP